MKVKVRAAALLLIGVFAISLMGCKEEPKTPDFSNAQHVAKLATLECSSHNVMRLSHEGSWLFNKDYRKMWYEYTGTVELGVDASKVVVHQPDSNGVVKISMPGAIVLGCNVDEDSFTDPLIDKSWFFTDDFTAEERAKAFEQAQGEMESKIAADETLLAQASKRAKDLLEQYVKNVAEGIGESYTVVFEDVEE